jgi:hypothetical protein
MADRQGTLVSHYHSPYYSNPVWLEREQMLADQLRTDDDPRSATNLTRSSPMSDPFTELRIAAKQREACQQTWEFEVRAARAAGYSLRAIADVAGVSHDTVWKLTR